MTAGFARFAEIRAAITALPEPDKASIAAARARDAGLTKPPGALARLEDCVFHLAGWQHRARPQLDSTHILIFAGNHGVAARGVSAFPAEVTAQMVTNFERGGAAINQLAKLHGAKLSVTALALDRPTQDFTVGAAMTEAECLAAVNAGAAAVPEQSDLLLVGEMGIGNTTVAAALAAALHGGDAQSWVGAGTGVNGPVLANKVAVVAAALAFHGDALQDPLEALRRVGGRELAAIFGAVLTARLRSIPVMLDGFVTAAAAAPLARLAPAGLDHCLFGHVSAEQGHRRLLDRMKQQPLLDLGMRLGEGSGAAVALGVLKAAIACHNGMATFAEASVSNKED